MYDPNRIDYSAVFQFDLLLTNMLEQSDSFTEQDGYQMNLYLVEKSSFKILLSDIRTSSDHDVSVACGRLCLLKSAFNTIRDKDESLCPFGDLVRQMVSENKRWHLIRVICKAILRGANIIGPPAHDNCPRCFKSL